MLPITNSSFLSRACNYEMVATEDESLHAGKLFQAKSGRV